jgi:hypothetical protein
LPPLAAIPTSTQHYTLHTTLSPFKTTKNSSQKIYKKNENIGEKRLIYFRGYGIVIKLSGYERKFMEV